MGKLLGSLLLGWSFVHRHLQMAAQVEIEPIKDVLRSDAQMGEFALKCKTWLQGGGIKGEARGIEDKDHEAIFFFFPSVFIFSKV